MLGVPFKVKQAEKWCLSVQILTNIPEHFLSSKALDILCTALSKRPNQTMVCFKAEATASPSWRLLLFPITKHSECLQMAFFGLTSLQKWYTLLGSVIFLFFSSPRLQLRSSTLVISSYKSLDQWEICVYWCLLVLKRNPLKESFISLQDNTYLSFL